MSATTRDDDAPQVPPDVPARTGVGQWWSNAPLRLKHGVAVALVAVVWLLPIGTAVVIDGRLAEARDAARASQDGVARIAALEDAVQTATTTVQRYLVLGLTDIDLVDRFREIRTSIPAQVDTLGDRLPPDLADHGRQVDATSSALLGILDRFTAYGISGPEEADVSDDPDMFEINPALVGDLLAATDAIADAARSTDELHAALDDRAFADGRRVDRLQSLLVWSTLAAMVVAVAAATTGTYLVTHGIVRRIERLSENADRYMQGTRLLPSRASSDEVGQLTDRMRFAADLLDERRRSAVLATRAKEDFLSGVSHELKTPLTAMIGFGQLIQEDPHLPPARLDDAGRIVDAGHMLQERIEGLLDVKSIEAGKVAVTIDAVPVHEVVDGAVTLVEAAAHRAMGITVDCPANVAVAADRRRLGDAVVSLLADAVRRGDTAHVTVDCTGDVARIAVTTSQRAAPADGREPPRTPSGRRRDEDDLRTDAVALELTGRLVHAMGGRLGTDIAPGGATTSWIELPLAPTDRGCDAAGDALDRPTRPSRPDPTRDDAARPAPAATVPPGRRTADTPGGHGDRFRSHPPRRSRNPRVPRPVRARTRLGQQWIDAPLRIKLLLVLGLIGLFALPPIGVALAFDAQLAHARDVTRATARHIEDVHSLETSLRAAVLPTQSFQAQGLADPEMIEEYRTAAEAVPDQLARLEDGLPRDLAPLAQDLTTATDALLVGLDDLAAFGEARAADPQVTDNPRAFEVDPALVASLSAAIDSRARVERAAAAFEEAAATDLAADRAEVDRLQQLMVGATVLTMAASLAIAAGGTYLVANSVLRRIERLAENADRFTQGVDLLPAQASADEIGRLTDKMLLAGELLEARRQQAVAANRAKDEFVLAMTEALDEPLVTMTRAAERIRDDDRTSRHTREDATHIVDAGRQLRDLTAELVDIQSIESGAIALATEAVPLAEVARGAVALVRSLPGSRSLSITSHAPPDLVAVADRRRLHEVLLNLLSNAVKYNRPGGRVDLNARRDGEVVTVSVSDTGAGISPDDLGRLFQPFERLRARETDVEGSGIGLVVARRVVEAMGGTIGVDSVVGEGSTFWFTLPHDAGDDPAVTRPSERRDGRSDGAPVGAPRSGSPGWR